MANRFPLNMRSFFAGFVFAVFMPLSVLAQASAAPPSVSVAKPVVKDISDIDEFIGRFEAVDQVDILARVSGYLDQIHFVDGATIKAGDLLFTIDQRPYKAVLDQAEAQVESAKVRVDFASSDLERAEKLSKNGNIAEQLLDQRRSNYLTARAELDRAQGTLKQARLDMEFTVIRSPLSGKVSRRLVSIGNLIAANQTVLTNIVTLNPIYFYFDVDERTFIKYNRNDAGTMADNKAKNMDISVAVTGEVEPKHKGMLDFVDNRLDAQSGTLRARAVLENHDLFLTPGLFGRIRIVGSNPYKGILVPDEAIGSDQDRRVVYVVGADNVVSTKPVKTGARVDGYRAIVEGLKGDELLVINGLMRVRPGTKITPQSVELPLVRGAS